MRRRQSASALTVVALCVHIVNVDGASSRYASPAHVVCYMTVLKFLAKKNLHLRLRSVQFSKFTLKKLSLFSKLECR